MPLDEKKNMRNNEDKKDNSLDNIVLGNMSA